MNPLIYNGLALAYIGDAYYELEIRRYLLEKGYGKVNDMHKRAITYTSGSAQCKIIEYLLDNQLLSAEEIQIYKKGRNANSSQNRRNIRISDYLKATGFETLIGFLVLSQDYERINEIMAIAKKIVEVRNGKTDE